MKGIGEVHQRSCRQGRRTDGQSHRDQPATGPRPIQSWRVVGDEPVVVADPGSRRTGSHAGGAHAAGIGSQPMRCIVYRETVGVFIGKTICILTFFT